MKIELDLNSEGKNVIEAYTDDSVTIAGNLYQNNLIISPDKLFENWGPSNFDELSEQHFEHIISLKPEIVLLGTGRKHRFPKYEIMDELNSRQIGLEVMDTGAVCRAYNFLVGEGREVIAALLIP